MGKPLVRFCEGQEFNCDMDKILWHRRESRRKQRKQILPCSHGSLLSTRKCAIFRKFKEIGGIARRHTPVCRTSNDTNLSRL